MNEELNNQEYNNISLNNNTPPQKKGFNILFVIIPVAAAIIAVVIYFIFFVKENKNLDNNTNNTTENTDTSSDNENQAVGWNNYNLIIDGKEIKLPIKVTEFLDMGFYEMDTYHDSVLIEKVQPKSSSGITTNANVGDIYGLFTNGTTNFIALNIYNNSNEVKSIKDCYIYGISFEVSENMKSEQKIGEVKIVNNTKNITATIGKTKYEDIVNAYSQYTIPNSTYIDHSPNAYIKGIESENYFGSWMNVRMNFNEDTKILETDLFSYYDIGNIKNQK